MPDTDAKKTDLEFHKKTAAEYDRRVDEKAKLYHSLYLYPFLDRVRNELSAAGRKLYALDIGCGTGSVTIPLAERGFNVAAIDHSAEMIGIAKDKASKKGLSGRIEFIIGDAEALPFNEGAFSLVTCQGVLHHVNGKEKLLREMRRVTADDGYVYISEPVEIFSGLRILALLGKAFHLLKGEKSAEAPLIKKDLLGMTDLAGMAVHDHFLVFYVPFLPLRSWERIRGYVAERFKNKRLGSIIFLYARAK